MGRVAQLVEQLIVVQKVVGSNPIAPPECMAKWSKARVCKTRIVGSNPTTLSLIRTVAELEDALVLETSPIWGAGASPASPTVMNFLILFSVMDYINSKKEWKVRSTRASIHLRLMAFCHRCFAIKSTAPRGVVQWIERVATDHKMWVRFLPSRQSNILSDSREYFDSMVREKWM